MEYRMKLNSFNYPDENELGLVVRLKQIKSSQ